MSQRFSPMRRRQNHHMPRLLPLPITIELDNVFPAPPASSSCKRNRRHHHHYDMSLLQHVRLDIVIDDKTLYSQVDASGAVCLRWQHLTEHYVDLSVPEYEVMLFRFLVRQDDDIWTPFLEVPAHPAHLYRVAARSHNMVPLNAVFVNFSDGAWRVPQSLYGLLDATAVDKPQDNYWRFGDRVFRTLDQVFDNQQQQNRGRWGETNDDSLLDHDENDGTDEADADADEHQSCDDSDDDATLLRKELAALRLEHDQQTLHRLERLTVAEEAASLVQRRSLHDDLSHLQTRQQAWQTILQQTDKVRDATRAELPACGRAVLALQTIQIQLLHQLARMYPIMHDTTSGKYTIAGIELALHVQDMSEDETVSAALGHVAHVTYLLSKYLRVPLRYPVRVAGSRSDIADNDQSRTGWFPLYLVARSNAMDRDKLEHGIRLLTRNVDHVLYRWQRVMPTVAGTLTADGDDNDNSLQRQHILAKLKCIFDSVKM